MSVKFFLRFNKKRLVQKACGFGQTYTESARLKACENTEKNRREA